MFCIYKIVKEIRRGITILSRVIDPDYQETVGLLQCNRLREKCIWYPSDPSECLWCPKAQLWRLMGKGNSQYLRRALWLEAQNLEVKVWIIPPRKPLRPPRFAGGEETLDWIVEEWDNNDHWNWWAICSGPLAFLFSFSPRKGTHWNHGEPAI